MISVRDLTVWYGSHAVLKNVSFEVRRGECLVVTGASGCGKSTLAHMLTGIPPAAASTRIQGAVRVADINVLESSIAAVSSRVGIVFQNPRAHLFHLRVDDEIAFGPRNLGLAENRVSERVAWALNAVGLTNEYSRNPASLSGGQIQRLAIAAALAMKPEVLVLDEPTASLDVPGTQNIITALEALKLKYGLTIILIEHRLAEVCRLADRVLVLDEGRIAAQGRFEETLRDRGTLQRYGLRRPTAKTLSDWPRLLVPNGHHPTARQPLLHLKNLSAGYEGQAVVRDVDLKIFAGEFTALVGDNGAGKSTLALAAAGLLKPMVGSVTVSGTSRPRPGLDIALLFQNPADQLFSDTVDEEVAFGPRNYRRFDSDVHERTLAAADLEHLRTRRPFSLSIGQQQRAALAACLALRPALIILDEPTLGQDWRHLRQLMDCLVRLNREGTAILLITHDYKLVHHYARRVILMEKGRLILDGKPARLSSGRIHAGEFSHAAS